MTRIPITGKQKEFTNFRLAKVNLSISEIKIQSAHHLPFLFNSPTSPKKVPSIVSSLKVDSEIGNETCRDRGWDPAHAQRSVQTRKGRLPSGKCCFISNTFTVSGLFSDTERLAHPPTCSTSTGLTPFSPQCVHQPNHRLHYQTHHLAFTILCCFSQ